MFVFMYLNITIENGLSDLTKAYNLSSQRFIRKISGVGHYTKNFTHRIGQKISGEGSKRERVKKE